MLSCFTVKFRALLGVLRDGQKCDSVTGDLNFTERNCANKQALSSEYCICHKTGNKL